MLAGRIPMLLSVTAVDEELIHSGEAGAGWSFDRGWGPDFGISGSYLVREARE
jgi:hypothetical protein